MSGLPRYVQISEQLIREISAGVRPDGSRLPPERDMAAQLGVSVGTLRQALADVEEKGMLERVQGSGNYVKQGQDTRSVYAFFRLELVTGGGLPTADVLSVDLLPRPENARTKAPQSWRIRRNRALDGIIIAVEEIWLDANCADGLTADDLGESLYLTYRDRLGLVIGQVEDRISASARPDWADALPKGTCGYVERHSKEHSGAIVEYSTTWFDLDKARYVSRLGKG